MNNFLSLNYFIPEIELCLIAIIIYYSGQNNIKKTRLEKITLIGYVGILASLFFFQSSYSHQGFHHLIVINSLTFLFKFFLIVAGILSFLLYNFYNKHVPSSDAENHFYSIVLILGGFLLISANNLILIFLAIEIIFISVFFLLINEEQNELKTKYLNISISGIISSLIILLTFIFIYGLANTLNLQKICETLIQNSIPETSVILILLMVFIGIGINIVSIIKYYSLKNFNNSYINILVPIVPIIAGFGVGFRIILTIWNMTDYFENNLLALKFALGVIALLVLTIATLLSIIYKKGSRIVKMNVIAHLGFVILGLSVFSMQSFSVALFYLITFLISYIGVIICTGYDQGFKIKISKKGNITLASFGKILFLLSLVSVPFTIGFSSKFALFALLISEGSFHYWFVVVGLINSILMLYVVMRMLHKKITNRRKIENFSKKLPLLILIMGLIIFQFYLAIFWESVVRLLESYLNISG